MQIFYYGCNCGNVGKMIRKVRSHHPEVEIINTKYDSFMRELHAQYLESLTKQPSYPAIIIDDDSVQLLKTWKP